ncbi:hypothetical protein OBV_20120 [Oscillibacter valericigenes Sjm18-20]|nr:hypothetical protein OBV_20120 [Oscillibacter valericigenes Sjm18-20]
MEEKMKEVSVLELLLKPELPDVRKVLPEKEFKIDRLSELAGRDVIFRLRGLSYKQVRKTQEKSVDERSLDIVLEGCVEPDFHDKRLLCPDKGIATPLDAISARLTSGEIDELSVEIQKLSGYLRKTLSEVKNG